MAKRGLLDFTAIRRDTDFRSVLTHYDLMPADTGNQIKIHCPFHDDGTPSCSVNLEKGIYRCFGCPAKGNVLDFIAEMEEYGENATFKAAQKALEIIGAHADDYRKDKTGATKAQNRPRRGKGSKTAGTAPKPVDDAPEPSCGESDVVEENPILDIQLKLDPEHEYLADRGIDRELAEQFGMGYCKAGIMKNRIAIPIHNQDGELVAFTGRWTGPDETIPEKENKYKLPKGFRKALEVFNLHRAADMGKKYVVIVEGIWSTVRLHAAGVPTVALLGTSLDEIQAEKIGQAFKYAIVILDGDEAGRLARPGVIDVLSQHVYVKTITLDEGVKPDTMDDEIVDRLRL